MSRTRSISTDVSATSDIQTKNGVVASQPPPNWVTVADNAEMKQQSASAKLMIDEVSPSFHRRRSAGEIIMNPCESWSSDISRYGVLSYEGRKILTSSGQLVDYTAARAINGTYTSHRRYNRVMIPDMGAVARLAELDAFGVNDPSLVNIEQLLLAEATEKASSPETLALVTAAELDKTVQLMTACGKSVNRMCSILESLPVTRALKAPGPTLRDLNAALRKIGRLKKKHLIKQFLLTLDKGLRDIATLWLGYRYGVMATIYDLESWIDAANVGPRRSRFTASRTSEYKPTPITTSTSEWILSSVLGPMTTSLSRVRRTTTTAGVLVSTSALSSAEVHGINRVASSIWELTPFSFVLDWIVDIGTRLAAIEGALSVRPIGSWVTHEHNLLFQYTYQWHTTSGVQGPYTWQGSGADVGSVTENCTYIKRVPNPKLYAMPQVNVKLNWKRLTDSAALLSVLTTRFRQAVFLRL